jgi:malic enzyme
MDKQKTHKVVLLDATFPELKTGAMYQRSKGVASTVRAAAARAMGDLLKQPKVKGKRFSTIQIIMSIGTQPVEG